MPISSKLIERHRLAVDAMLQRDALQQFHGDERHAGVLVNVVNGADAGMIQRGGGLRFALESRERGFVLKTPAEGISAPRGA